MSSVGQAAGGLVGAVIGFWVGGPSGAYYGAQIGLMVGGAIDPPKGPTINGPRLNDLSVQTSTYGAFIPRDYGTVAQAGNIFWLKGDALTEVPNTATSSGKGGPETTTNIFSYFATFAVGLCEGPITGVRRIWIGSHLFYDAGSDDVSTLIASNANSDVFTLYLGTDTQTADPLIQADKGAANVPAYRGLAYIVFDNLPLEKYQNSLAAAQVKVEIVSSGSTSYLMSSQSNITAGTLPYAVDVDDIGTYAFVVDRTESELKVFNVVNRLEPFLVSSISVGTSSQDLVVYGEYVYVVNSGADKLQAFSFGSNGSMVFLGETATGSTPQSLDYFDNYIAVINSNSKTLQVFNISNRGSPILLGSVATIANYVQNIDVVDYYAYVVGSSTFEVFDLSNPFTPVSVGSLAMTSPFDVVVEGSYAYIVNGTANTLDIIDVSNPAAPALVSSIYAMTLPASISKYGDYVFVGANDTSKRLTAINVLDPLAPFIVDSLFTDSYVKDVVCANGLIYSVSSAKMFISFFAGDLISSSGTPLSNIVSSECLKSNLLTAGDIDVTDLTDSVRGYRVSQLGAIRGGIDPLRAAWPFDVRQHGYQIEFVRRGGSSVATIPASDLDARAAGQAPGVSITDAREMDLMLPRQVAVKYLDSVREYDINEQTEARANTDAVGYHAVDLPIVMTADEAKQATSALLYLFWMERYDISFVLPPAYQHLEPGDPIDVVAANATYNLRLTSVTWLSDGRIECRAKYNSAALYTQSSVADEGQSTGATLGLSGPSAYELLDIPLIRDDDNTAGFPMAMAGYLSGWPGGVLYRSDDSGQSWSDLTGVAPPGAVIGYATSTLAAHGGTVIDFTSTLAVKLYSGSLASVTQAQMFAGQNWFAYGAHGRWEIIAAQNCVLQGDGSYVLSDFLRGQKGSEWATGLHVAYDRLVLLDAAALAFVSVNASTIGATRSYRAITIGKTLSSETDNEFAYAGVNLECLSPVHLTGSRHPSTNDWTLTWTRRGRLDSWRDYVDLPLGETSESYEVEIYSSGTYATLKRTLTGLASATAAYTSTQQVTDFGSNQATLYLKVYQLSATVGRGYALTQSITR